MTPAGGLRRVGVTGTTGTVGAAALAHLTQALGAARVVALARRPEAVGARVSRRRCDYDDVASLHRALDGLDALLFVSSDGDADVMLRHHLNVVSAVRASGVRRVVYLSSVGADLASPFCYDRVNALTENLLADTPAEVVVVRAGLYEDFLHALMGGDRQVRLPVSGDAVLAPVPRTEVGHALAEAMLTEAGGPVRHAVGPRDRTLADIAHERGQRLLPMTMEAYRTQLVANGESPWWSFAYATLLEVVDAGRYASPAVTDPGATTSA